MSIEAARLFVSVGADTRQGEQGIKSFNDKMNNAARGLTMTGAALTAGITLPLLAIGKAALDSAMDFEQNMNILQQVSGATADTMSALQDEALRLGAVTSFSAGEAAEGMLELAKAGMSTEEVLASIGGVMDLAAAGGVSLAEAAGLVASTLNAFGLEASESSRIADLLAGAANASAASIGDLGAGMQQAGFAFDMANQPVENLATSLAILTNVGLTGSDAGTALKNAFMRMMNPTLEAAGVMDQLGISFYDAAGNMKALPDIIDVLNVATAGLTAQERDQALATIFLSDGMKAMIPLMDAGSEGFNTMLTSVTAAGAATSVADARMRGLSGGIEFLKGSVDSFLIGAALPFLDTLGGLARGAGDALTAFGALPPSVINASLAFLGILAATGPLIAGLGLVVGALAFLLSPLGLIVIATGALAAAWVSDFGGIQEKTAQVVAALTPWFGLVLTGAQELAQGISAAFGNTDFPSLESLWSDFQAGDFQRVASAIRSAAFELMVNLDTELKITATAQDLNRTLTDRAEGVRQAEIDMLHSVGSFEDISRRIASALDTSTVSMEKTDAGATGQKAGELFRERLELTVGALFVGWQWADAVLIPMMQNISDGMFTINTNLSTFDYGDFSESLNKWGQGLNDVITEWVDGFIFGLTGFKRDRWDRPTATEGPDSILSQNVNLMAMPDPTWVTNLLAWEPETPQWITSILDWQPTQPEWISNILNWEPSTPGWVTDLLNFDFNPFDGGGGSTEPQAQGSSLGGARVSIARRSSDQGSGQRGITINVNVANVASDMDVHALAATLAKEFQRRVR